MKRAALLVTLASMFGATSCSDAGFGSVRTSARLVVELDAQTNTGSREAPLPLRIGTPVPFKVRVRALNADGTLDTSFSRFVRIGAKPGAVASFAGADVDGRNVLLRNGESILVEVRLANAYGPTYIVADDLGYVPADPLRTPPPSCSNGIDDDGDGTVDFPADTGCAYANDDSETAGSYAEGATATIYFALPRVADLRGLACTNEGCTGNGKTPYSHEQIFVDTGWRDDNSFRFDTIVTRLSSNGFFLTDVTDARGGFNSLFTFNFSTPTRMRVCDRLKTFGGTASEFFGFTQLSYPTWTLEEWDPGQRLCLVPKPDRLTPETITTTTELLRRSGNLVRIETTPDKAQTARVTPKFGPADMPCRSAGTISTLADKARCDKVVESGRFAFVPGGKSVDGTFEALNATNCDFDKNGKINSFLPGDPEGDCSTACSADAECTEYSNYALRGTFRFTVSDGNGMKAAIQADASSANFDPYAMKGVPIRSFTGTMTYFSGGAQYTIEARCKDDIILDLKSYPYLDDFACATDSDCAIKQGLPPDFRCVKLGSSSPSKGCRKRITPPNPTDSPIYDPPPLACVFPRTFLENNPQ
jgi:hypothetical protein